MSFVEHITRTDGEPYLTRYHLMRTPWLRVYLHRIHAPDWECLHDHPWAWWMSLVLWGGYTEAVQASIEPFLSALSLVTRRAGSLTFHGRGHAHRIMHLHQTSQTWTLLVVGPHVRSWGFFTKSGWIDHSGYVESRDC